MSSRLAVLVGFGVFAVCACWTEEAAALLYNENVTFGDISTGPADPVRMLFGAGINGGFTVDRRNGVELGLRAQLRFDANNHPKDVYNSNGDGTYSFPTGTPDLTKTHPDWASETTPVWSVVFSVNTDYEDRDGTPGRVISDYTYEVGLDFDPVGQNNWLRADPVSNNSLFSQIAVPDHAFGMYPQQSPGIVATTAADYLNNVSTYNIVQNTTNFEFFNMNLTGFGMGDYSGFDPNEPGVYTVYLAALLNGVEVARTQIEILVGQTATTPNVIGMTQDEAQSAVEGAGFALGAISLEYSYVPAGRVISQDPAPGGNQPTGTPVKLVLSKGEAPKVPLCGAPAMLALAACLGAAGMRRVRAQQGARG